MENEDKIYVLTGLVLALKEDDTIWFTDGLIVQTFGKAIDSLKLENYLNELRDNVVTSLIIGGEDGFETSFNMSVNRTELLKLIKHDLNQYFEEQQIKLNQAQNDNKVLNDKLEALLNFSPQNLLTEMTDAKEKLENITRTATNNDLLKPLLPTIKEVEGYLVNTSTIIKNYENIYQHIIKPIKNEGKQGVKATVFWAIFGIIVTTIVSIAITYFSSHSEQRTSIQPTLSCTDSSPKIDFIINELIGLNRNYNSTNIESIVEIFQMDTLLRSDSNFIIVEPRSFEDRKITDSIEQVAGIRVYIGKRVLSPEQFHDIISISPTKPFDRFERNQLMLTENDTLIIMKNKFLIDKIFQKSSEYKLLSDTIDGIKFRTLKL